VQLWRQSGKLVIVIGLTATECHRAETRSPKKKAMHRESATWRSPLQKIGKVTLQAGDISGARASYTERFARARPAGPDP
jgi:hypothetical protein